MNAHTRIYEEKLCLDAQLGEPFCSNRNLKNAEITQKFRTVEIPRVSSRAVGSSALSGCVVSVQSQPRPVAAAATAAGAAEQELAGSAC